MCCCPVTAQLRCCLTYGPYQHTTSQHSTAICCQVPPPCPNSHAHCSTVLAHERRATHPYHSFPFDPVIEMGPVLAAHPQAAGPQEHRATHLYLPLLLLGQHIRAAGGHLLQARSPWGAYATYLAGLSIAPDRWTGRRACIEWRNTHRRRWSLKLRTELVHSSGGAPERLGRSIAVAINK